MRRPYGKIDLWKQFRKRTLYIFRIDYFELAYVGKISLQIWKCIKKV